jgi:ribonucleoside-diphosphate reductase beta chain
MTLIEERRAYQPFEYDAAYDYWLKQQQSHWLWSEIAMASCVDDWEHKLTEEEKKIIAGVLLGFTQVEIYIGSYWAQKVSKWFPKPEVRMMAATFAAWEGIHAKSYNYLNETLGLEEYDAFLQEPTAAAKIDNLVHHTDDTMYDKALSLAVYSGFGEGVSLYSSFAILLHFSTRNLLKGVGEIITFSVRDELIHTEAGCWLFRTLMEEYPYLAKETDLYDQIIEAAKLTVELEFNFIDMVFNQHKMEGLNAEQVKEFIKHRANLKLSDLGLSALYEVDDQVVRSVADWFYLMTAGEQSTDFFAARVTNYAKGNFNPDLINWNAVLAEV